MVSFPKFKSCCCGCSLRTGSLIIAWLNIISAVLILITVSVAINQNYDGLTTSVMFFMSILTFGCLLSLAFAVLLIVGIEMKVQRYVYFWLLFSKISLSINVSVILFNATTQLIEGLVGFGFINLEIAALHTLIGLYYILVVHSFWREMSSANPIPFSLMDQR